MVSERESPDGLSAAEFHRRPGVAGWRVTSWGPQAVFVAPSFSAGARLLPAIVTVSERFRVAPDVDLRPEAVVVRVPYRGAERIPAGAADFAAEVSAAAETLELSADPTLVQTVDLAVAQQSGTDTRPFWTAALGYEVSGDVDSIDPLRRGPRCRSNPSARTALVAAAPTSTCQSRPILPGPGSTPRSPPVA